jgi:hypothetical protein
MTMPDSMSQRFRATGFGPWDRGPSPASLTSLELGFRGAPAPTDSPFGCISEPGPCLRMLVSPAPMADALLETLAVCPCRILLQKVDLGPVSLARPSQAVLEQISDAARTFFDFRSLMMGSTLPERRRSKVTNPRIPNPKSSQTPRSKGSKPPDLAPQHGAEVRAWHL